MMTITVNGGITRDLSIATSNSGVLWANVGLATTQGFGKTQKPIYFDVPLFGEAATTAQKRGLKKGSQVILSGQLVFEEYEGKDGQPKQKMSIKNAVWEYLPSGGGQKSAASQAGTANAATQPQASAQAPASANPHEVHNLDDDDLPF